MQITDYVSTSMHPHVVWLGKISGWLRAFVGSDPPKDLTHQQWSGSRSKGANYVVDGGIIERQPDLDQHALMTDYLEEQGRGNNTRAIITLDMFCEFFSRGPKFFVPTLEQWESMTQVKPKVTVQEFASPYSAISIRIPQVAKFQLADRHGIPRDQVPGQCLVRWRKVAGEPTAISLHIGQRFGVEGFYHFMEPLARQTLESELLAKRGDKMNRMYQAPANRSDCRDLSIDPSTYVEQDGTPGQWEVFETIARASLNLCIMLTHFGCRLNDRNDPERAKNRQERREMEQRKSRDFAAVELKQAVVIRAPSPRGMNPPGPGTGIEVTPHWRRGHWRAYPGQAQARRDAVARGEQIPLVLVRPTLVRRNRLVGDESETTVTYRGESCPREGHETQATNTSDTLEPTHN